jgi:steroid delta-isomerase-like uncharacterized protein
MEEESNPATIVSRWAALWSTGELADADRVFARDLCDHRGPPLHDIAGIEGEKRFIDRVRTAFPDLRVEIEDMVAQGNRVAARVMHRGTHRGDFFGIAPTGTPVAYEGTVIFRVAEGRIAERWGTIDLYGLLAQLGAAPALVLSPPEIK